eukprot:GILK01010296.1.p1 GENE.GILK01010296.1~~GILK01010296.1.p1  ORF type:complete len:210 (-),score=18.84 GILK01010296.1:131-760(-)
MGPPRAPATFYEDDRARPVCFYGLRCRKIGSCNREHIAFPPETAELVDTKRRSQHDISFRCAKCNNPLINSQDIYRINKNAVWCDAVTENCWVDPQLEYHPFKQEQSANVFCFCSSFLGTYFPNYNNEGIERYKLEYINKISGRNIMVYEGNESTLIPLTPDSQPWPRRWRSDKRDLEERVAEDLGRELAETLSLQDMTRYARQHHAAQ